MGSVAGYLRITECILHPTHPHTGQVPGLPLHPPTPLSSHVNVDQLSAGLACVQVLYLLWLPAGNHMLLKQSKSDANFTIVTERAGSLSRTSTCKVWDSLPITFLAFSGFQITDAEPKINNMTNSAIL